MNFANGKIYCIRNSINDEVYVGSTIQRLSKRLSKHKSDMKNNILTRLYKEMKELGVENFYIELIEAYPCNSKEELNKRENEYIRQMGTLNFQICDKTKREYSAEFLEKERERAKTYYYNNREQELERGRKYKEDHKEYIKQKNSEVVECECGALVSRGCLTKHRARSIHQQNLKGCE